MPTKRADIQKHYQDEVPTEILERIITTDPTYNPQRPQYVGHHCKTLIKWYKANPDEIVDNLNGICEELKGYDANLYGGRRAYSFDTYRDWESFLMHSEENGDYTGTEDERFRKDIMYDNEGWMIVQPSTYDSSRHWGGDTRWCTAASSSHFYENYSQKGKLFINIEKATGKKYQFHFETNSFMDADDRSCADMDFPRHLLDEYTRMGYPAHIMRQHLVSYDENAKYNITQRRKDAEGRREYNLIDKDDNLVLDVWASQIHKSDEMKLYEVSYEIDGKHKKNFVDFDGKPIFNHPMGTIVASINDWFIANDEEGQPFTHIASRSGYHEEGGYYYVVLPTMEDAVVYMEIGGTHRCFAISDRFGKVEITNKEMVDYMHEHFNERDHYITDDNSTPEYAKAYGMFWVKFGQTEAGSEDTTFTLALKENYHEEHLA